MDGCQCILFGAEQQPDEHSGHSREGETTQPSVQKQDFMNVLFFVVSHTRAHLFYFFISRLYLVVGEDTNQHWDLLDRPEWPCLRKCLGVEWWESFYTVPIVCNTVTTPVSENNSFNLHNQHKRVIIVHSSIYWSLTKIISPLSDTGCKASLITGVMILGKTVVRWSDITLDSGMTRTAV